MMKTNRLEYFTLKQLPVESKVKWNNHGSKEISLTVATKGHLPQLLLKKNNLNMAYMMEFWKKNGKIDLPVRV